MSDRVVAVGILERSPEALQQSKDEEYAYWQNRMPAERLLAISELNFAFFEGRDDEAEIRRQFLRFAAGLPNPWR